MPQSGKRLRHAAVAIALVLPAGSIALADVIDPSLPRAVTVGAPRGAAPSERLDPQRTGRSRTRLPFPPVEAWRRHVSGGIELPPVVDEAGGVHVALTTPEIVKVGPDAKEIWRVRVGGASPLAPPTLTSDGTLAVVTRAGQAWGITPGGAVRYTTSLGINGRDADVAPLARSDGGLVIAAGNVVLELDADGVVRARGTLDDRAPGSPLGAQERAAGAVIEGAGGALVTTDAGSVYRFHPPSAPRRLGSFGGSTRRGATLLDERTLIAVVDNRRVVALDLVTGATHARSGGSTGAIFDGPVTLGAGGLALTATETGTLLGLDAAGNEKVRVALEKPLPSLDAGVLGAGSFFVQADLKPSPPIVLDPAGRVAFVRSSGRAGVVGPDGRVELASERVCSGPVAVLPAGEKRMLIACRDGGLWMYGE